MSDSWRMISSEMMTGSGFFGRRKKKLDPLDFVAIKEGFHTLDICHWKCSGRLMGLMSIVHDKPQEVWSVTSLKHQNGGVPIKNELHCVVCDNEDPDWIYEPVK